MTVGDFNGDGRRDIAAADYGANLVNVYLNQGPTNFPSFSTITLNSSITEPISIVSTDFDGDSDLDLAIANLSNNTVAFFSNDGAGGFFLQSVVSTGGIGNYGLEAGDFDGDGDKDVAVTLYSQNQIRILRNNGAFNFVPETPVPVSSGPFSIDVADFNGDGRADIAVGQWTANVVTLLLNTTPPANQPPSVASNNAAVSTLEGGRPQTAERSPIRKATAR